MDAYVAYLTLNDVLVLGYFVTYVMTENITWAGALWW